MTIDRYQVNDALGSLADQFGVTLDDATLNELTHHVANVLETPADVTVEITYKFVLDVPKDWGPGDVSAAVQAYIGSAAWALDNPVSVVPV